MLRTLLVAGCFVAAAWCPAEITIRMMAGAGFGIPPKEATDPRSLARRAVFEEFMRQNPGIRVVNAGGLEMTGPRAESMFLMSMAGDTAPDVFYVNFRQYHDFIDQGFCRPLDDLIARDPESMARVNPIVMDVLRSFDGRIYAIPWFQVAMGLYYRRDFFRAAGLDPNRAPQTWDEFLYYARRITETQPGRSGFAFSMGPGYHWSNFVFQAGGQIVERAEDGQMRATIATEAGVQALEFYRRLVVERWRGPDGELEGPAAYPSIDFANDIRTGKIAMWFSYTNDVVMNMGLLDIPSELIGIAPMPMGPVSRSNEINAGMWAINANVTCPEKLEACWRFIKFFAGDEAARINTERMVEVGMGHLVSPTWLRRFGHYDILARLDPAWVRANEVLFLDGHPEPHGRNTQQVYVVLDSALEKAKLDPDRPAMDILLTVQETMNRKLLGYTPPEIMAVKRGWATGILILVVAAIAVITVLAVRHARRNRVEFHERLPAGSVRARVFRFVGICLFPAAGTLLLWQYYPLLMGLVIAFQDYRIMYGTRWVGLDNFIGVFTQPIFYRAVINSFVFVALTIVIGFFIPIFLALALNEIPRFKVFFRTVFFLPAMTSGVVIALLWRQFYDRTEEGLLNTLLAPGIGWFNGLFGTSIPTVNDWLGNPSLAMFAVVLPGIWAGAGPGSILYLAALKNIPEERYEAADLDGATWWHKVRFITLPGLKALILINLLGVFIASFKAMETIFLLTGGGPLYATHTLGLEIWTNAFMFLKFGYATAAAWVMGAILIGFTLIQIRSLLKMRFTTAKF
jgi:multiple sugar transport system permease protein